MTNMKLLLNILAFSPIFFILISCGEIKLPGQNKPVPVEFSDSTQRGLEQNASKKTDKLYVAVSAMISPKETFAQYKELIDYLSARLGQPIEFKQRKTYREVNNLLKEGKLDFAFICSGAYVRAIRQFPLQLVAVPEVNGKPLYYAYIIVHKSSPYNKIQDLEGKSFAFTDPLSNTGHLFITNLLKKMNREEDNYFSRIMYTYGHDYAIQAVARQLVDGATVDGLIYDFYQRFHRERVENVRIIQKSEEYGIPPVVAPVHANYQTISRLRNIFLHMHEDTTGKRILTSLMIDRFSKGSPENYTSIRHMLENISE